MEEIWKEIPRFNGRYSASTLGRIRNNETGIIRKTGMRGIKYRAIPVNHKSYNVSRLVAETFCKRLDGQDCVDHINGDTQDDRLANLRWASRSQNSANKLRTQERGAYLRTDGRSSGTKWRSTIRYKGKNISLGTFATRLEALAAWNKKALELFGEFAILNKI